MTTNSATCMPSLFVFALSRANQVIQSFRFEKALKEYVLATGHAAFDEDISSASKNAGSAHWRLALLAAPGNLQLQ